MVLFTFSVLDQKYPFCKNFVQKNKIVSVTSNLVLRLIWICKLNIAVHFFLFSIRNTLFGYVFPKNSKLSVSTEICYLHYFEQAAFNSEVHFFVFNRKYPVNIRKYQISCEFRLRFGTWWWRIVFVVCLTEERRLALFPGGTIARAHPSESPGFCDQGLNFCRT